MKNFDLEDEVSETANSLLGGRSHLKLLEAGCGSSSHIRLTADVYAVGIDISREELDHNDIMQERILGDIQEYSLPKEEFDIVVCWMVLEHLSKPKDALLNMFRAVKPQGIVVLGFPNLLSIKGVVTKFSPFWFHRLFYHFMKYTSHHFPTYLRVAILPKNVMRFAESNGFSVELCRLIEGGVSKKFRGRFRLMNFAFAGVNWVTRVVSFGRLTSPLLDNCAIVLRKRGESS
jgi:2-polyprenyl-3-methyl-5-hydroxy-6-metoxy-1,4-benzoquinol methylase